MVVTNVDDDDDDDNCVGSMSNQMVMTDEDDCFLYVMMIALVQYQTRWRC